MKFYVGYFYPWCDGEKFKLCAVFGSKYEAEMEAVKLNYNNPLHVGVYDYLPT